MHLHLKVGLVRAIAPTVLEHLWPAVHRRLHSAVSSAAPIPIGLLQDLVLARCTAARTPAPEAASGLEPGVTFAGVSEPFLVGCHCAARSGRLCASEVSRATRRPGQNGQPEPMRVMRAFTDVRHWCSRLFWHCHQTWRFEPETTSAADRLRVFVGGQSAAAWCHRIAR